jgi:undecaprenyl-diphosphatase
MSTEAPATGSTDTPAAGTRTGRAEIVEADRASAVRSPADVMRAIVSAVALLASVLVQWLFGEAVVGFTDDLLRGLDALPAGLVTVLAVAGRVLALVFLAGGFVVAAMRGRWRMLVTAAAAAAIGVGVFLLVDLAAPDAEPIVTKITDSVGPLSDRGFPTAPGLAAITAIVTACAPWLERRMRRLGWVMVWLLLLARFLLAPVAFASGEAVLAGWFAGSLVLVALGAPPRRPEGAAIAAGLARVGVPLRKLEQANLDARGSTVYFAEDRDGRSLFVKALGDDERSADLMFRLVRRIQPRDFGDEKPFSSLRRAVEHEALVAFAARNLGVSTPRVVAFTTAEPNGYVLAYEAIAGKSLDRVDPALVDDVMLDAIWSELSTLRRNRIAHRDLRLANMFLDDRNEILIIDFGFSELAASDLLLATDLAELLASSTLQVGVERSVARALAAVGPEALASSLPRLRPPTLSGATRTAYKQQPGLLEELRSRVSTASDG